MVKRPNDRAHSPSKTEQTQANPAPNIPVAAMDRAILIHKRRQKLANYYRNRYSNKRHDGFDLSSLLINVLTLLSATIAAGAAVVLAFFTFQANKDNRDALITIQRPFVSVSMDGSPTSIDHKVDRWWFTPTWHNNGNTPTRDMFGHTSFIVTKVRLPADWDYPDIWLGPLTGPVTPSNNTMDASAKDVAIAQNGSTTASVAAEVAKGRTKYLYIWGWVKYKDPFYGTELHVTRYAAEIYLGGDPTRDDRSRASFVVLRKYNCADDECAREGHGADWNARIVQRDVNGFLIPGTEQSPN